MSGSWPVSGWADRRVLITGGAGFLGSNLAHALAERGARLTLIDSFEPDGGANAANLAGLPDSVRLVRGDLRTLEGLERLLGETGLPGSALELLVDEAGADDAAAAIATVQALRALGATVTLQGLAQASASLAALPQYRADRVLVARRFVEQLPDHDPHRLLVHAVVSLAATQGLEVHAEGVDTPGQRAALAALGVSAIEGAEAGACTPDSPSAPAFPPA